MSTMYNQRMDEVGASLWLRAPQAGYDWLSSAIAFLWCCCLGMLTAGRSVRPNTSQSNGNPDSSFKTRMASLFAGFTTLPVANAWKRLGTPLHERWSSQEERPYLLWEAVTGCGLLKESKIVDVFSIPWEKRKEYMDACFQYGPDADV